jgi:hypothetical protein
LFACSEPNVVMDASEPDAQSASFLLDPDVLLDFDDVPFDSEMAREVTVHALGGEPLLIETIRLSAGSEEKWRFDAEDVLFEGLAPGASARLTVRLRPCPEGWMDDRVDPSFDFSSCFGRVAAGALELVTNAGRRTLSLAGRAGEPPPIIEVGGQDGLQFSGSPQTGPQGWTWVNITNRGYAELVVEELEIRPGGESFWFLGGCLSRCPVRAEICVVGRPACKEPLLSIPIAFSPPPFGTVPDAELVVRSNDPIASELVIPIRADTNACALPSPWIDHDRVTTIVGQQVILDAYQSSGAGSTITGYEWSWIESSTTPPPLDGSEQRRVGFYPTIPGIYLLGLDVQNACGWTQVPHVAVIQVE